MEVDRRCVQREGGGARAALSGELAAAPPGNTVARAHGLASLQGGAAGAGLGFPGSLVIQAPGELAAPPLGNTFARVHGLASLQGAAAGRGLGFQGSGSSPNPIRAPWAVGLGAGQW